MKKFLLSSISLIALASTAQAADLAYKAPRMQAQVPVLYTFTGTYIGGHLGAGFRDNDNQFNGIGNNNNDVRFIGGGQVGFDYQFLSTYVIGFEANYSYVDRNNDGGTNFPGGFNYNDRTRGLFSATGRLGYALGTALIYGKGGYASRDRRESFTGPGGAPAGFNNNGNSRDGYTVGGGLEYLFMPNWSAKVEYQYYEFERNNFIAPPLLVAGGNFRNEEHTVKVGVNYRFNFANFGR